MSRDWYEHEREERSPMTASKPLCRMLPKLTTGLWPRFDHYLRGRGLDVAIARRNLWFPSYHVDGYPRVVMPGTSDETGNLYWQARLLDPITLQDVPENAHGRAPRRYESPHGVRRGRSVVAMWPTGANPTRSVVVEGPMDALAAAEMGYYGIALMGVTPGAPILDFVATLVRGTECSVIMDVDQPEAMIDNLKHLVVAGITCRLISPAPWKDLAAASLEGRRLILAS